MTRKRFLIRHLVALVMTSLVVLVLVSCQAVSKVTSLFRRSEDGPSPNMSQEASNAFPQPGPSAEDSPSGKPLERNPLFWEVRCGATTVYLFGSIHLGKEKILPFPSEIEEAFAESDYLVVEADISGALLGGAIRMASVSTYPSGDGLERHVPTETMRKLVRYLKANDMEEEFSTFRRYKPWFVAFMVEGREMIGNEFDPGYGIDLYFLKRAGRRRVIELESVNAQIDLLNDFTDAEQALLLDGVLDRVGDFESELDTLLDLWIEGNEKELAKLVFAHYRGSPEAESIGRKLIGDRNKKMTRKIITYLESDGTYFVVAGLAHFIEKGGIVDLLETMGYEVKRVEFEDIETVEESSKGS